MWKYVGKSNGSIDLALMDASFLKNKLIMEQIELILWDSPEDLARKPYVLTDALNKQYLSGTPGLLRGNIKQGIYGKLDCPSALRHIANGKYVQNRVFFKDEETAIAAGYRPFAICMPEEYKKWKYNH